MNPKRLIPLLLAVALLLCGIPAPAENAQADLQARFGGQATLEYGGKSYAVKKRLSTMMIAVCQLDQLQLMYLLAVDDNANRIAPIRVDVEAGMSALSGDTLARIYSRHTPPEDASLSQADADAQRLLTAVNGLFPEDLIESYLVLSAEGLDLLDGGASPDPALSPADNTKARIKAIGKSAMNASGSEQMDMVEAMSPYLTTDIKTGAMMKAADKATRYEIAPTQWIGGEEAAMMEMIVEYFYDETAW